MSRGKRSGYRRGDWLVIDDESGLTVYASETVEDYYGRRIIKDYADWAHPQDFIKARDDPKPLPFLRPDVVASAPCNIYPEFVGVTDISTSALQVGSPAAHLYQAGGIGDMEIGCSFIVR